MKQEKAKGAVGRKGEMKLEEKKQIIRVLESKGFTIVSIRITWELKQMSGLHLRPIKPESPGTRPWHWYF